MSNNVKKTMTCLGVDFTLLEARSVQSCIFTVRCKRLATKSDLDRNNLVSIPMGYNNNCNESGLVMGVFKVQSMWNKRIHAAIIEHEIFLH